ncbi:MAG: polysaccharide biosynthesis protein [Lentilactobacillus diolivorans]|nr:polysaccharide biosynthesis protein [Lentilactobacillus diolivorans]
MMVRKQSDSDESRDQMLSGSAWMTAGSILSRFLGAIYIIPWGIWFGNYFFRANALYGLGYNIYSFFLIAAIAGIPSAIAKQVAHYNALNEYGVGVRLYKRGLVLAAIMGIICAAILYFGAPLIDDGNPNVIPILRSLAWAVLIIPTMSLTRGYFQGYQQMAPSAISQFVEQLARVLYMLLTAFVMMQILHVDWVKAVSQSTFAAFVGAAAGMISLMVYYLKHRDVFRSLVRNSNNQLRVSPKELYREIVAQAVPFIILGAGITIFMLIDQFTFFKIMRVATTYSEATLADLYAMFAVNANKLIMITVSLASALAITAVPLLSIALTNSEKKEISRQISNVIVLFLFVMIPASLGMAAIAGPLNRVFYGTTQQALGANILTFSSIVSIPMGLFVVISAVMQGLSENKRAVRFFLVGTLVKLLIQWPCIYFLGAFGPLLSTGIGLSVANWLILRSLDRQFGFEKRMLSIAMEKISKYSLFMYLITILVVHGANIVLGYVYHPFGRSGSLLVSLVGVGIGGLIYIYLTLKSRIADMVLGPRSNRLRRMLRIR